MKLKQEYEIFTTIETDDGDLYGRICRPICPLCLFNVDIRG